MRLSVLFLFTLSACTPYSFPKEIAAVSSGVDQMSDGFTSGLAGLAADRDAKMQLDLTGPKAKVAIASSCLVSKSQNPCGLYVFGTNPPAPTGIEKTRDETMAALAVLKNYAHALAAVTNAADRTAYDAAVAQLSGAVGALAKNADAAAPGISTVAPAAVNIVGWLVGAGLDQQRFDSLRAGIVAASTPNASGLTPINIVATTLGGGLTALSAQRQAVLIQEANILEGRLNDQVLRLGPKLSDAAYKQGLDDTKAVVATLDGLRQVDPTGVAADLVKAHDALVAAVSDPSRNYPGLLKAVGDFATEAAALQTALATTTKPQSAAANKGG